MRGKAGDKELYPALLVTLVAGVAVYLLWRFALDAPAFPACWVFTRWQVYCPACGGTRAAVALLHGRILQALYWNPTVPVGAALAIAYLASQTVWRLRGKRGGVLCYSERWLPVFLMILIGNCVARNLLLRLWEIHL